MNMQQMENAQMGQQTREAGQGLVSIKLLFHSVSLME